MKKTPVHISELSTGHMMAIIFAVSLLFMQYAYPSIHLTSAFTPNEVVLWIVRLIVVFGYFGSWWYGATAIQSLHVYLFMLPDHNNMRQALKWISRGLLLLIAQFIVTGTALKLTRAYALTGPEQLKAITITLNVLFTYLPLLGFACIYAGTSYLKGAFKRRHLVEYLLTYGTIAALGLGLVLVTFTDIYRLTPPPLHGFPAAFYLPDWATVIFFILPLFISWSLAMQSALRLYSYGHEVSGSIYRKQYQRLSDGLRLTCFTIIVTQCTLFASNRLALSGMEIVVTVLVLLAILSAYGLRVIAKGSKGLTDIETIV